MEPSILLSLSALIALLIHVTFSGMSILITRKRKHVFNGHTRVFVPNVLARWPWPRRINPNYAVIRKEAVAWMTSFRAFSPKAQDAFNQCDFSLLASLVFPTASKEHLRAGCDLMHLFFMFDEYSDRSSPSVVRKLKDVVLDALRNPHTPRPKGEWIGGEFARQFWELTIQNATAVSQKRFIRHMNEYLEGVVQEIVDKNDNRILDIKSYIDARRRTSGVKQSFSIIELGLDIPDDVMYHPAIQEIVLAAVDMVALSNDIFSYNLEQLRGDDLHNIITCVMNEHHTDVNGAILWVEDFLLGVGEKFHAALAALPQWEEPLNSQVKQYCHELAECIRGNDEWSFESKRYFGNKGQEIKKSRWMFLMPKKSAGVTEIGSVHIDSSLL